MTPEEYYRKQAELAEQQRQDAIEQFNRNLANEQHMFNMSRQLQEQQFGATQEQTRQEQEAAKQLRLTQLAAQIAGMQAKTAAGMAELQPQLGELAAQEQYKLGNVRQQGVYDKANLQDQMVGRGLGLSGIREGAEARRQHGQLQGETGIGLEYQQRRDALNRAATRMQAESAAEIAEREAERKALGYVSPPPAGVSATQHRYNQQGSATPPGFASAEGPWTQLGLTAAQFATTQNPQLQLQRAGLAPAPTDALKRRTYQFGG